MDDAMNGGYKAGIAWGTNFKSEAGRAKKYSTWVGDPKHCH